MTTDRLQPRPGDEKLDAPPPLAELLRDAAAVLLRLPSTGADRAARDLADQLNAAAADQEARDLAGLDDITPDLAPESIEAIDAVILDTTGDPSPGFRLLLTRMPPHIIEATSRRELLDALS